MPGWFELRRNDDGQFRFVVKAGNGETVLTSELYGTRAAAEGGMSSVRSNSSLDERYERKESAGGQFFFTLKAANHQVVGTSQMYASAQSREAGIDSVRANGSSAIVKDHQGGSQTS